MEYLRMKEQIQAAPVSMQADLMRMLMFASAGEAFLPELAAHAESASTYQEFFDAVFGDQSLKSTLLWAECARLNRRNWIRSFTPKIAVENLRMKTDGLPVQMGEAVFLAPTGSRDNIANFFVFENGAFNRQAADFVTSIAGKFTVADYEFLGIYGVYKYRGNVILEEWDVEREAVLRPQP